MVEVGRDLRMSFGPTLLLKQGSLKPAAQDCVQIGFEYLQAADSPYMKMPKLFEKQWPILIALHSQNRSSSYLPGLELHPFITALEKGKIRKIKRQ